MKYQDLKRKAFFSRKPITIIASTLLRTWSYLVFLLLLIGIRGPDLVSKIEFNPDEAELLLQGERASKDLVRISSEYALGTTGPVWPMFLGLLARIGVTLSLPTAHMLTGLIYLTLVHSLWVSQVKRLGTTMSFLAVTPIALLVFSLSGDYRSMSNGLLPTLLLSVSTCAFSKHIDIRRLKMLLLAGFLIGLSPLAKPQFFFLSLSTAITMTFVLLSLERNEKHPTLRHSLIALWSSLLLPSVVVLANLVIFGNLKRFLNETARGIFEYTTQRNLIGGELPSLFQRAERVSSFFLENVLLLSPIGIALLGIYANKLERSRYKDYLVSRILISQMMAMFATLLFAFPLFQHYGLVLLCGGITTSILITEIAQSSSRSESEVQNLSWTTKVVIGSVLVVCVSSALGSPNLVLQRSIQFVTTMNDKDARVRPNDDVAQLCPKGSSAVFFGWSPELYLRYGLAPGSRYIISSWQLQELPSRDYHKAQLVRELIQKPPDCIVDVTGPEFFGKFRQEDNLWDSLPDLQSFLNQCYKYEYASFSDYRNAPLWTKSLRCGGEL